MFRRHPKNRWGFSAGECAVAEITAQVEVSVGVLFKLGSDFI